MHDKIVQHLTPIVISVKQLIQHTCVCISNIKICFLYFWNYRILGQYRPTSNHPIFVVSLFSHLLFKNNGIQEDLSSITSTISTCVGVDPDYDMRDRIILTSYWALYHICLVSCFSFFRKPILFWSYWPLVDVVAFLKH